MPILIEHFLTLVKIVKILINIGTKLESQYESQCPTSRRFHRSAQNSKLYLHFQYRSKKIVCYYKFTEKSELRPTPSIYNYC